MKKKLKKKNVSKIEKTYFSANANERNNGEIQKTYSNCFLKKSVHSNIKEEIIQIYIYLNTRYCVRTLYETD